MTIIVRALCGIVAIGVVLGPAAAARAADLSDPQVEVSGGTTTLKFSALTTEQTFTKKDGTTVASPTAAPEPGDKFTFADELRQGETLIGSDTGTCVTETEVVSCAADFTFAGGTIRATGSSPVNMEEMTFAISLVSGTGKYAGITGNGTVVNLDDTHANIVLRYSLAEKTEAAESSAQVAEVPTGGAATGGGNGPVQDSLALLGVGAVVALVGGRLFAARKRH